MPSPQNVRNTLHKSLWFGTIYGLPCSIHTHLYLLLGFWWFAFIQEVLYSLFVNHTFSVVTPASSFFCLKVQCCNACLAIGQAIAGQFPSVTIPFLLISLKNCWDGAWTEIWVISDVSSSLVKRPGFTPEMEFLASALTCPYVWSVCLFSCASAEAWNTFSCCLHQCIWLLVELCILIGVWSLYLLVLYHPEEYLLIVFYWHKKNRVIQFRK